MALITSGSRNAAAVPARSSQSSSLSMLPETSMANTSFRSTASAAEAGEQQLNKSPIVPATKAKACASTCGAIFMDCSLFIMGLKGFGFARTQDGQTRNAKKNHRRTQPRRWSFGCGHDGIDGARAGYGLIT